MKKIICIVLSISLLSLTGCSTDSSNVNNSNNSEAAISSAIEQTAESVEAADDNRFLSYDFSAVSDPIVLNENPIITKELPSGYEHADYTEPTTVRELLRFSTQMVVVHIPEQTIETAGQSMTGNPELDAAIAEKTGSDLLGDQTLTRADVKHVVFGDLNIGDSIKIFQPGGDWGVTLTPGEDYLVTMKEYKDNYKLTMSMNSVFEIDDDFVITSQSSMTMAAKFNGLSLADTVSMFSETAAVMAAETE